MTDHLPNEEIRVAGHLEEKRGIYQIILNWKNSKGVRKRQSVSTGLPIKGNKTRAMGMLEEMKRQKKSELEEHRAKEENQKPGTDGILFSDFLELWLKAIKPDIALTTYGSYASNVEQVIAPYFREKGVLLSELTPKHLNTFYTEQKKRVKVLTVQRYHANISNALKYAVENDFIEYSIMGTGKVKRPVVPKNQKLVGKFLRLSEIVEVFDKIKGHKLELGVILAAYYGLRRSEVLGLRWESIDFDANSITIEHTVTQTRIDGKTITIVGDTTKSKTSNRSLPLVPTFRQKLLSVKEEQEHYRKLCGKSYNQKEGKYVYTDPLGNRINPSYLTRVFPDWMEQNGFPRLRFHDLRHTCASLLLACGVSLKQIQEWLGHSTFAITADLYAHLDSSSKVVSAQAMTWLDNTLLAQDSSAAESHPIQDKDIDYANAQDLPEMVHMALVAGASKDDLLAWLKENDFTKDENMKNSLMTFIQPDHQK